MLLCIDCISSLFLLSFIDDIPRQEAYTEAAKEIHGPEFDVMNSPIDATAVYKARHGKKHGRFMIGNCYISTPATLSEVQTTSTMSADEVCPRRRLWADPNRVSELEAKLQQEIEARKRLEEMFQVIWMFTYETSFTNEISTSYL